MKSVELPYQICRADRHCLPNGQEEAIDVPPHLSSPGYCLAVLYPAFWQHVGVMGAYHLEPDGARGHVLVLFPDCPWHQGVVEGMDHPSPDCPVRYRPW